MNYKKLSIKANDLESCDLISSLLQDSILHISHISFHEDKKCLRFLLNRFCWESVKDFESNQCYFRAHSGLYIHNVDSIVINDNFKNTNDEFLNLLSAHSSKNEINLVFSKHYHIRINTNDTQMHLKDLHHHYPTTSRPEHGA